MKTIYLDNAATTFPKPPNVIKAVTEALEKPMGTPGRGSHEAAFVASGVVSQTRKAVAKFFGLLEDYRVIFTYSATDALNMAIKGFLNTGDRALISSVEHNSVLRPLKGMERDGEISLGIIACDSKGYIDAEDLRKKLRETKTRLVCVSHASNVTGALQDVAEIGKIVREEGAYFLLDAAQTAGVAHIDQERDNVDFLTFAGHKNMFGLQGTGCLLLGSRIFGLRPFREGGTGFNSESETQPVNWPEAFESGTHNVPGILSLGEGIKFINETGIDAISCAEAVKLEQIRDALSEYENVTLYGPQKGEKRVALLSFNIKGWESADVGSVLNNNHGVITRTGLHCSAMAHKLLGTSPEGTVRLSPGYFTRTDEIEEFINIIQTIVTIDVPWY